MLIIAEHNGTPAATNHITPKATHIDDLTTHLPQAKRHHVKLRTDVTIEGYKEDNISPLVTVATKPHLWMPSS